MRKLLKKIVELQVAVKTPRDLLYEVLKDDDETEMKYNEANNDDHADKPKLKKKTATPAFPDNDVDDDLILIIKDKTMQERCEKTIEDYPEAIIFAKLNYLAQKEASEPLISSLRKIIEHPSKILKQNGDIKVYVAIIGLCKKYGIIDAEDERILNEFMNLRNNIGHFNSYYHYDLNDIQAKTDDMIDVMNKFRAK